VTRAGIEPRNMCSREAGCIARGPLAVRLSTTHFQDGTMRSFNPACCAALASLLPAALQRARARRRRGRAKRRRLSGASTAAAGSGEPEVITGPVGAQLAMWQLMRRAGQRSRRLRRRAQGLPHWPGPRWSSARASSGCRARARSGCSSGSPSAIRSPWPEGWRCCARYEATGADRTGARTGARDLARRARWPPRPTRRLLPLRPPLADLHVERLDNLLWAGHSASAERMLDAGAARARRGWRARIALQARAQGVNALIDAGAGLACRRSGAGA
jgi:soluble lytic murein transglycosylase